MNEKEKNIALQTQKQVESVIKTYEAETIAALKEKLKGLELAYDTDLYTVPVTKVAVADLIGVTMNPWESFWEHKKIDLRTPVILGREKNVIAGPMQYFHAVEQGFKEIDAVYIDSLRMKWISSRSLKEQFRDENICKSFGYSLYALVTNWVSYIVSFDDFSKSFDELLKQEKICSFISDYIDELEQVFGG